MLADPGIRGEAERSASSAVRGQLVVLCVTATLEGADLMLLGATLRALALDLNVGPARLGVLALAQSLLMSCCGPIWASISDRQVLSRRTILTMGCMGWGVVTVLLANVVAFETMVALRCFNGVFLACLNPISQGIVSDITTPDERGKVFGSLLASMKFGELLGMSIAIPLSSGTVYGHAGWRVAYCVVGVASIFTAFRVYASLPDEQPTRRPARPEWQRCIEYFRIPTFCVIVGQGVFGAIPWNALAFLTMYLQLVGLSQFQTTVIMTSGVVANMAGQFLGGLIGDYLEALLPMHGRALTAQLCIVLGKPSIFILLLGIVPSPDNFYTYLVLVVLFNILGSWALGGTNRPVLSEIARPEDRASMFALDIGLEGVSAALFGASLVGLLAEKVFGYPLGEAGPGGHGQDHEKAVALGKALSLVCAVPWILSGVLYTLLHFTYKHDYRAAMVRLKESDGDCLPPLAPVKKPFSGEGRRVGETQPLL